MATNSFGNLFRITTFGESHGSAIGVIVDGCPAKIKINEDDINFVLALRKPGRNSFVSPRNEDDKARILSGIFAGQTTGAPIAILIENTNIDNAKYEHDKYLLKPGHANFTYLKKYGIYNYYGGGRASARETACRVAAGVIARKVLEHYKIKTCAYVKSIGLNEANIVDMDFDLIRKKVLKSPIYCPDEVCTKNILNNIEQVKIEGDSLGGVVEFIIDNTPVGLGDPIYEKFSAKLASAMFSIPGVKGFELGEGFHAAKMLGSKHNDPFTHGADTIEITLKSNKCGGILGGITTGTRIIGRVAFKPTPSINKPQNTVDIRGKKQVFQLAAGSRHDPCIAIRGTMVVEAMCNLVIVDAILMSQSLKII